MKFAFMLGPRTASISKARTLPRNRLSCIAMRSRPFGAFEASAFCKEEQKGVQRVKTKHTGKGALVRTNKICDVVFVLSVTYVCKTTNPPQERRNQALRGGVWMALPGGMWHLTECCSWSSCHFPRDLWSLCCEVWWNASSALHWGWWFHSMFLVQWTRLH